MKVLVCVCVSIYIYINSFSSQFSILQAEELIVSQKLDKEYLPISGNAEFAKEAIKLALGDNNPAITEGLVCIHDLPFPIIFLLLFKHM